MAVNVNHRSEASEAVALQTKHYGVSYERAQRALPPQNPALSQPQGEEQVKQPPSGPALPAPQTTGMVGDGMGEFLAACQASFDETSQAATTQTANIRNLSTLTNDLSTQVLQTSANQMAADYVNIALESTLNSDIATAQGKDSEICKILSYVGYAVMGVMVLAELVCTCGAGAALVPEEVAGAEVMSAEAGAEEGSSNAIELDGKAIGPGSSVSDLQGAEMDAENNALEDSQSTQKLQKDGKAAEDKGTQGFRREDGRVIKTKTSDGDKMMRLAGKLRPNPQSLLFRVTKAFLQLSGAATQATPGVIQGADKIAVGNTQEQLAPNQALLADYKGAMEGEMMISQSFTTISKKEVDVNKDLTSQIGAEITLSGDAFSTWSKIDIAG